MKRLLVVALALAFTLPPAAAWAGGGMGEHEENPAQTAQALAIQALSLLLEHQPPHEQAIEKLHQALAAGEKGEVDLRALRAAHAALHREDEASARRLLEHAFPGGSSHVVGVTFRPRIGTAELAAGIAGAAILAVATFGLTLRRRADRRYTG